MIIFQSLIYVYETEWLRALTLNQKLKQNAQTQDADGRQFFSVLYTTHLEAISQHEYLEKNSAILLTNLHLLRRFRSKLHPCDGVTTDALIVPVKRY